MVELKVYLSEELDKRFRMLAMSVYGYGRGSLSKAAVDALTKWCAEEAAKSDKQLNQGSSLSSSDPVTRAEERPGMVSPGKEEDSGSALRVG
ncbi:MAG: hypothetical protein AUI93_01460 [Crenarchaeota archaeon 13_1_40CM_3_52_10]|nr:MAG: hypothetical protein AUI93_01460 [Crenarchaeota archaeon 13_1_40CM_3_52_10]OLE68892.1 MAG: hypothetical protein AUF78_13940 [archaeon 13_1_20CM_2_51_12]